MSNFKLALPKTLVWEGNDKITEDPDDAGGLTKYGIAKRSHPELDIANLTYEQAEAVYEKEYWLGTGSTVDNQRAAEALFDLCVNLGKVNGVRVAQRALGILVDGNLGPKSQAAINADPEKFINRVAIERIRWYSNLAGNKPSQVKYLRGWISRAIAFS